jgi:hypothetical protein
MWFTSSSLQQTHVHLAKTKLFMIMRSLDTTCFVTKKDTGGTLQKDAVSGVL